LFGAASRQGCGKVSDAAIITTRKITSDRKQKPLVLSHQNANQSKNFPKPQVERCAGQWLKLD
jgi:hypothetical protein